MKTAKQDKYYNKKKWSGHSLKFSKMQMNTKATRQLVPASKILEK